MLYIAFKWLHIIAAIASVGANITYGVWIVRGSRQPESLRFALGGIKFIDDRIANPAYAALLLTGLAMTYTGKIPLTTSWLMTSLILYLLVVAVGLMGYTPTLRQQIEVLQTHGINSNAYRDHARRGHRLGGVVGVLVIVIVFLMVAKPQLW